jgi:hypothetical protein
MTDSANIQKFKEMAGTILGKLYACHPSELQSEASDFIGFEVNDEEAVALFDDTVNYLTRAGYLHRDDQHFLQLTPASWDVLQEPNPLLPGEAIGSTLAKWVSSTASDAGKATFTQAASSALGMLYFALKTGIGS